MGDTRAGPDVRRPSGWRRRLGLALAGLAHRGLRLRRSVVASQIAESFPDRDRGWVEATVAACYRHFGEQTALLAGGPAGLRDVLESARVDGATRSAFEAVRSAHGAVFVTGHIGNWELAGAYLAFADLGPVVMANRQGRVADRWLEGLRTGLGMRVVYRDEGPRPILRALREGRTLGFVADQHTWQGSIALPFLGRPAWIPAGPARLASATGAPLYFGTLLREGEGYRVTLVPVEASRTWAEEDEATALTRGWIGLLERSIGSSPEQYFWFHRRWKGVDDAARAIAERDAEATGPVEEGRGLERGTADDVG